MELSRVAELQVLLEGVPLPVGRDDLARYAEREGGRPQEVGLLRGLPDRRYGSIDEVAEELRRVQPPFAREEPHDPREESGAVPGGPAYTERQPESGEVRDKEAVTG